METVRLVSDCMLSMWKRGDLAQWSPQWLHRVKFLCTKNTTNSFVLLSIEALGQSEIRWISLWLHWRKRGYTACSSVFLCTPVSLMLNIYTDSTALDADSVFLLYRLCCAVGCGPCLQLSLEQIRNWFRHLHPPLSGHPSKSLIPCQNDGGIHYVKNMLRPSLLPSRCS